MMSLFYTITIVHMAILSLISMIMNKEEFVRFTDLFVTLNNIKYNQDWIHL